MPIRWTHLAGDSKSTRRSKNATIEVKQSLERFLAARPRATKISEKTTREEEKGPNTMEKASTRRQRQQPLKVLIQPPSLKIIHEQPSKSCIGLCTSNVGSRRMSLCLILYAQQYFLSRRNAGLPSILSQPCTLSTIDMGHATTQSHSARFCRR